MSPAMSTEYPFTLGKICELKLRHDQVYDFNLFSIWRQTLGSWKFIEFGNIMRVFMTQVDGKCGIIIDEGVTDRKV